MEAINSCMKWLTQILGHRSYRLFVVICHPRTGSNLLISYLAAHPNIKAHGEIFKYLNGATIDKVYNSFYSKMPRHIKASGFKLFYSHPEDGERELMLQQVERMQHPVIIHLTRKDKLRTLVSLRIAQKTDLWAVKEGQPRLDADKKGIIITPEDAEKFLSDINRDEDYIARRFQDLAYIHITYEDLVRDPNKCLHPIFTMLELPPKPVKSSLIKSNPESLKELIMNFAELEEKGIIKKFSDS